MLTKEEKNYIDHHYENILKILYNKNLLKKDELLQYVINCGIYSNNISDKAKLLNSVYSIKLSNKGEGKKAKTKQKQSKKENKKTKQKQSKKNKAKTKQKRKQKKQSKKNKSKKTKQKRKNN